LLRGASELVLLIKSAGGIIDRIDHNGDGSDLSRETKAAPQSMDEQDI